MIRKRRGKPTTSAATWQGVAEPVEPPSTNIGEFRASLRRLPERLADILSRRVGLHGPPPTLEELGKSFGLTRERIRQLESRAWKRLQTERWVVEVPRRLELLLRARREPLWLALLPALDEFFDVEGITEIVLLRLIEAVSDGRLHCFRIDGAALCTTIREETYTLLKQTYQARVKDLTALRPSQLQVQVLAESLAMDVGARELGAEIYRAAEPLMHFAKLPDSKEVVLVAFGRGIEHVVVAVLEESTEPLHYSAVHRLAVQRIGDEIELRRVHNALAQRGIYLFGRGIYGLRRHLRASESEIFDVRGMAEEIVLSGDPDRQWHTREILRKLESTPNAPRTDFTAYDLNIILSESKRLRYLNRMVWVANSSSHRDSADRIDIAQACTTLLREAGRPLTRAELLDGLKDWRGVGDHFQLHGSEEVLALSPGVWGLRERDLPLTPSEITTFMNTLHKCLSDRGTGLHQSEIVSALVGAGFAEAEAIDPYLAISLAGTDHRFRVALGGYVGMSEWDGPRRLTLASAARVLAEKLDKPEPVEAMAERLAALAGRPVSRQEAINAMRGADFNLEEEPGVKSSGNAR